MLLERAHLAGLLAFALLLGLFEGPAEIACAFALVTFFATRRTQGATLGAIELGLLVWLAAGSVGVLSSKAEVSSETLTRPVLVIAFLLGKGSLPALDARWLSRMAWLFGGALVLNGAYGLLQVFGFDPPLETLIIGRQKHASLIDPENTNRLRMATGLFYNRIKLAHLGVVGLSLLAVVAMVRSRARPYALAGAIILGAAIFFTYRRAAPLSFVVALSAFGYFFAGAHRKKWLAVSAAVALLLVGAFLATETGRHRIVQAEDALYERSQIYGHALALWKQAPWFGVGHGHYRASIDGMATGLSALLRTSAHSWLLEALVETGLVGISGLVFAVGSAFLRLTRRLRTTQGGAPSAQQRLDRFAWIALLGLFVLGTAHSVLYHRPVALAFWVLLGVAAASPSDIRRWDLSSSAGVATSAKP